MKKQDSIQESLPSGQAPNDHRSAEIAALTLAENIEAAAEVVLYDHETRSEYLSDAERVVIVRAVKSHADMLAALKDIDALWSKDALNFAEEMNFASPVGIVWAKVRAAIAMAEAKP